MPYSPLQRVAWLAPIWLAALGGPVAADDEAAAPLRYVRPGKEGLVRECEVRESKSAGGRTYVSVTDRGREKMTLTIRFDSSNRIVAAELLRETDSGKERATLRLADGKAHLDRDGVTEAFESGDLAVVTTAPDWSDIFLLVRRYDRERGGVQKFAGLWIHPSRASLRLDFVIERLGSDALTVSGRQVALDRYRVRLRSGDYLVWADSDRRVVKLFPAGKPSAFVVRQELAEPAQPLGQERE